MRVAALYDIHGNLPALEAVLDDIARARVDRVVVGGDVVPGPMIRETLAALASSGLQTDAIFGNGEVAALDVRSGRVPAGVPEVHRPAIEWSAAQLTAEDEARLRAWPATLTLRVGKLGDVLFCHATPRSDTEIFTRLTREERIAAAFEGVDAAVVVCGHTHMAFDRAIAGIRVVNPGSVGMPFGDPGAYWLLLDDQHVEFRRTEYDRERAVARIRATAYPAAEFASGYVLSPPAEAEMLELFSRHETK